MKRNGMRPVPPGEILNEEFLKPLGMTANALAKAISVPPNRITAILKDERGITGDTAIRLGTFFKTSAEFWMNLQMTYDLRNAEKALPTRVRKSIEEQKRPGTMLRNVKIKDANLSVLRWSSPNGLCGSPTVAK